MKRLTDSQGQNLILWVAAQVKDLDSDPSHFCIKSFKLQNLDSFYRMFAKLRTFPNKTSKLQRMDSTRPKFGKRNVIRRRLIASSPFRKTKSRRKMVTSLKQKSILQSKFFFGFIVDKVQSHSSFEALNTLKPLFWRGKWQLRLTSCPYWFGLGCFENENNTACKDAADSYE